MRPFAVLALAIGILVGGTAEASLVDLGACLECVKDRAKCQQCLHEDLRPAEKEQLLEGRADALAPVGR